MRIVGLYQDARQVGLVDGLETNIYDIARLYEGQKSVSKWKYNLISHVLYKYYWAVLSLSFHRVSMNIIAWGPGPGNTIIDS